MKLVTIRITWETEHEFEVPNDWQIPRTLDGFTEEQVNEMTSGNAHLADWELMSTRFPTDDVARPRKQRKGT
jgi:hypothetical protein